VIERVLGPRWKYFFCFASGLLMFIVGVIYFLLINSTLYPMLVYIFTKADVDPNNYVPTSGGIIYDKFSIQYLCMIMIVVLYPMLYIKDFKIIVRMAHGGIIAIVSYVIFIIYIFIKNLADGKAQ
jgi:solute carrier family 38 (sodium-coupled neutral amino acid transporter), member 9